MAVGEIVQNVVPFYERAGRWLLEVAAGGRMVLFDRPGPSERFADATDETAFFLMDFVYELAFRTSRSAFGPPPLSGHDRVDRGGLELFYEVA
jgi:hypothetical protein